eukprot:CAMPEP_0194445098 /NCGR_PEP_ID=MMETSP0176-20130528/127662_1 /TAXON_ID=216777 /ORGANISM="Proboscia alata, Strain PI-D3" /LENGTH=414 /DNA_ID=CAMNT_0039271599 /DNA_START=100 /DNA_END=1341 /DNA_ORIENTATION=+
MKAVNRTTRRNAVVGLLIISPLLTLTITFLAAVPYTFGFHAHTHTIFKCGHCRSPLSSPTIPTTPTTIRTTIILNAKKKKSKRKKKAPSSGGGGFGSTKADKPTKPSSSTSTTDYSSASNDPSDDAYLSSLNRDTDEQPLFSKLDVEQFVTTVNKKDLIEATDEGEASPEDVEAARDEEYMTQLLKLSQMHNRNEHSGPSSPFPKPIGSCMIVSDGGGNPDMEEIIGVGHNSFDTDCVFAALTDAGIEATPLREWIVNWPSSSQLRTSIAHNSFDTDCVFAALTDAGIEATPLREWIVNWPSSSQLRTQIAGATLYTTLEPSCERRGTEMPPLTDLIHLAGIKRVVIGSQDPIAERATNGAAALHADGLQVYCGVQQDAVRTELIPDYISRINGKLARFGRTHAQSEKRPMGFL